MNLHVDLLIDLYIFSFIQLPWYVYISSNDFITSIIVGTDDVYTHVGD